jgi:hypothetical protein
MSPTQTQTAQKQIIDPPIAECRLKSFIQTRLSRGEPPQNIANGVRAYFGADFRPEQIVPYWRGEIPLPTPPEARPDKESVQFPADQPPEAAFTRMTDENAAPEPETSSAPEPDTAPDTASASATGGNPPFCGAATQTGRRQDPDSPPPDAATQTEPGPHAEPLQIPVDGNEPSAEDKRLEALLNMARGRPRPAADAAAATQTGRRQDEKTGPDEKARSVLSEEVKAFIVRGLARYETPSQIAASVQLHFGIAVTRQQVYAYDPAGSRRPAQCWIDLHAATRAKFVDAMSEIGIAQKIVRLRMLDRFANRYEEKDQPERAAAFLMQAAKECGGFYERYARPRPTA